MIELLRETFTRKGVFDAAPCFQTDFDLCEGGNTWDYINCFAWAIGYIKPDFKDHPVGKAFSNRTLMGLPDMIAYTNIVPIKDNNLENIPEGHYPIVGFIAPILDGKYYADYHWYRWGNNGILDHKRGRDNNQKAITTDEDCRIIINPFTANRTFSNGRDYSDFIGLYAVPKNGALLLPSIGEHIGDIKKHMYDSLMDQAEIKRRYTQAVQQPRLALA